MINRRQASEQIINTATYIENIAMSFSKCCIPCLGIFITMGILASGILYFVYSIIALTDTSYKELRDICPDSNLWIYLLLTLISSPGLGSLSARNTLSTSSDVCLLICLIIFQLGFICWGAYELWGVDCVNDIKSNIIYTMVCINISFSFAGIICAFSVVVNR